VKRWVARLLAAVIVALLASASVYQFAPDVLIEARFAAERLRAGAVEHRRTVGDHAWAWIEAGEGPPVVVVHGFTGSKENWLPLLPHLVARHRVIAVDLPGWGESQRRDDADYSVPAQAARLVDFMAALGLERPVLVGHSMGGHIAGIVGTRHGDSISRLVLVDAAGVRFRANEFAQRVLSGLNPFNVDDRAGWDRLMGELFEQPPWLPPRVVDALVARNVANHAFHARVMDALRREPDVFLLERELPLLRAAPTVVWCAGDRVLDVSSVDAFRQVPGSRIAILEGCGHMPMMEVPEALAAAMAL
jgi:pimeloyl-ACP methyl ester carboxylesterase